MTNDARNRIAAVLARYDSPSMRRDLARWYDIEVECVNKIAASKALKQNEEG